MLVELSGVTPGMPPFMNYVLQKFWEVNIMIITFWSESTVRACCVYFATVSLMFCEEN